MPQVSHGSSPDARAKTPKDAPISPAATAIEPAVRASVRSTVTIGDIMEHDAARRPYDPSRDT